MATKAKLQVIVEKEVQSASSDKTYTVKLYENDTVSCTCPAWKFQRLPAADRECKHTRSYLPPMSIAVRQVA